MIAYFFLYFIINTVFLFLSLARPNYLFTTLFFNFQSTQSSLKLSGGLGYTVIDVGLSVSSSGIVLLILVEFFRIRCVYLSDCLPVCLSICLSVCLSLCLLVCLSVGLLVCLSVCLSACLSACLSVCLSVCVASSLS